MSTTTTRAWQPSLVTRASARDDRAEVALCLAQAGLASEDALIAAREVEHALGIDLDATARGNVETVLHAFGMRLLDTVAQRL